MIMGSPRNGDNAHGSRWRDAANYVYLESLPPDGYAWEFLRRNPDYQNAWRALGSEGNATRKGTSKAAFWGLLHFEAPERDARSASVFWTPASLPSVVPLTPLPPELTDPNGEPNTISLEPVIAQHGPARRIRRRGAQFRLHVLDDPGERMACAVLPLDQLFAVRAATALRLWRGLTGRSPGRDPAELPAARCERLVRARRALDGRLAKASYRDIAQALFGGSRMPDRDWKTHDVRDRTVRLARLGFSLMEGGYRRLLLYPYRGRT
ncbi:MAG: DNA -binding domain-containing protein [Stellaceae bacterium]